MAAGTRHLAVAPGSGVWLAASHALGRPAPADEVYPHICGQFAASLLMPGRTVKVTRLQCHACTVDDFNKLGGE